MLSITFSCDFGDPRGFTSMFRNEYVTLCRIEPDVSSDISSSGQRGCSERRLLIGDYLSSLPVYYSNLTFLFQVVLYNLICAVPMFQNSISGSAGCAARTVGASFSSNDYSLFSFFLVFLPTDFLYTAPNRFLPFMPFLTSHWFQPPRPHGAPFQQLKNKNKKKSVTNLVFRCLPLGSRYSLRHPGIMKQKQSRWVYKYY